MAVCQVDRHRGLALLVRSYRIYVCFTTDMYTKTTVNVV